MEVVGIIASKGKQIGAVIDDNGKRKNASLPIVKKLVEQKKVVGKAWIIDDRLYLDPTLPYEKPRKLQVYGIERNDDYSIKFIKLIDNREIDVKTFWELVSDDMVDDFQALYDKNTSTKLLVTPKQH